MQTGLARECQEEIGADVTVGRRLHVAEVFKPKASGMRHQIEMLIACDVPRDYVARMGHDPDPSQIDTVWASPIDDAALFRPAFAACLLNAAAPLYLGVFDG